MDGKNAVTDMPPGTGQRTDNAEVNTFSGRRCDSVRSIASSSGPVTPKRYAQDNTQGMTEDNYDTAAAAALIQMQGATQTGVHIERTGIVAGSRSYPSNAQNAQRQAELTHSRSYDSAHTYQPTTQSYPYNTTHTAYNMQQEPNIYTSQNTDFGLCDTVMTLSRALTDMQAQQTNITGVLTGLAAMMQSMQSDINTIRGDHNEGRPTRDLNIPPGRGDYTLLSARGHKAQQSRIVGSTEVAEVCKNKPQPESAANGTREDAQHWAEADLPPLQQRSSQHRNQYQQVRLEARNIDQEGVCLGYGYHDTTGQGTFSRADGQNQQCQQSRLRQYAYEDASEGCEDYAPPMSRQNEVYRRPLYDNRAVTHEAKLPPFSGKEEWKIWVSRFEAVAKRRCWDESEKLDNLLPRLQGKAGEFVFSQLPTRILSNYGELLRELNSRFRVVETEKAFAAKFSQRSQRHDETVEEFAADLKRLYAKAYKARDERTRQENLVRRFLDGLKDHEARFEIEFRKEPDDIDTAVYHAVNFLQTRRRSSGENYSDRKSKRYVRRATQDGESDSEGPELPEENDEYEHAKRMPVKGAESNQHKGYNNKKSIDAPTQKTTQDVDAIQKLAEAVQTLVGQIAELKKHNLLGTDRPQPTTSGLTCYSCKQKGHIARECPEKDQLTTGQSSSKSDKSDRGEKPRHHLNY